MHHPRFNQIDSISFIKVIGDAVNCQPQTHPLPRTKIPGRGWSPWLANKLQGYKSSAVDNVSIS